MSGQINIRMDESIKRKIKIQAAQSGMTISEIIRAALEKTYGIK